ncbi:MAG: rRNA maturation RNase YbeY, partial [Pedosphaera parvula]|nr:rRNA maturation RNase YbeY [Pedosphaera parvula]
MSELLIRNLQRVRPLNLPLLRRITQGLLQDRLKQNRFELGIHLVGATIMARLNKEFLNHTGSTDVITFDHTADGETGTLYGEIFICVDDAVAQARQFGTTWQSELVRYVIHGILHLRGYDDLSP